jgi:predicted DNA-binding transcriptional regulator AlpA
MTRPVALLPIGVPAAFNTPQASAYTGLAEKTLETLRTRGGGPRFVKYGRNAVRYLRADLDAFMAERLVTSTSEAA